MVHKTKRRVPTLTVACLFVAGAFSFSVSGAQNITPLSLFEQANDARIQSFARLIQHIDEKASQATNEIELTALESVVAGIAQAPTRVFKENMGAALRRWTQCRNAMNTSERRIQELNAAIEAERARIAAPPPTPEEGALEGVIAQVKAELAGLEGRQQLVPALEVKLQAMPRGQFMEAAPRERLEAELAEARTRLPKPGEIDKARGDLAGYEADLTAQRATRPRPNESGLLRLKQQQVAVEAARHIEWKCAEDEKKSFVRLRAQALGFVELSEWLTAIINDRRQALAAATGVPSALAHCATMQGPFKCTGAFDGRWSRRCGANDNANGIAKVTFGPDGWVEVRMTNANPQSGEPPTIVGGRISADGTLVIERNTPGESEIYRGQFKLVTSTLASGAAKPIGSGTYEYVLKTNGQVTMRCSGSMQLN